MDVWRRLFGAALGRRLPLLDGDLDIGAARDTGTIRRDGWGVPHIDASSEHDAWLALGFRQAQHRPLQLELLVRLIRGRLSELVGADALNTDRLARRVGFRRSAIAQLDALDDDVRDHMRAFTDGINAGNRVRRRRRAHEFTEDLRILERWFRCGDRTIGRRVQSW